MKKILLTIAILAFTINGVKAQKVNLTGKVEGTQGQPLEYITVGLFKSDSIPVLGTVTDSLGFFNLRAEVGSYSLKLERFGQELLLRELILRSDEDLGILQTDQSVMLDGVMVKSKKKLVERKVDRLVYNVENSIASQGMSGLEALRNTPMLRIQDEGISIVGKGNVIVMINDRILNISESELTGYLQSLRSDDIVRIEVITTPPSKYEAQGNSGIINIVLKNDQDFGWSGNLNGTYQRTTYNGFSSGATVNYRSGRVGTSLKLRQYDYAYRSVGTRNLIGRQNSIYTGETRKNSSKGAGANYSLDYKINDLQNIGLIYDFNNNNYGIDASGTSRYENLGSVDSTLSTLQRQRWQTPTHTLNIYYDIKLDTTGKMLSIAGNYLSNVPDKVNDFRTSNDATENAVDVRNTSFLDYGIFSGQADLTLPYQFATMETGTKFTLFDNTSNVGFYNLVDSGYVIVPDNSSIFNYREYNYAAYFSIKRDFDEKWSTKAGLRYEYTKLDGSAPGEANSITNNTYGKFFPTAYINYRPNDVHTFTLSYSKRIERPSFQSLNPFRWYTNAYTYFTGTPTLLPSFNDNLELAYTLRNKFIVSLYYQYEQNGISNIARLSGGIYTNVIENSYNEDNYGLQLSYNDLFFTKWEMAFSATGTYTSTRPTIPEAEGVNVYSLSYSLYNTVILDDDGTWSLLVNFWHSLPYVYSNTRIENQLNFSPGIKTSFLEKKLTVSAVVSDLFKTVKSNGYSINAGFRSEFTNYFDQRRLNLSFAYSLGNNKVKGTDKKIQFEESSRAN